MKPWKCDLESVKKVFVIFYRCQSYGITSKVYKNGVGLILWSLLIHLTFFKSLWLLPITMTAFLPVHLALAELTLTLYLIELQGRMKTEMEVLVSALQSGLTIELAFERFYQDSIVQFKDCPIILDWLKCQSLKTQLKYCPNVVLGELYALIGLKSYKHLDQVFRVCHESGFHAEHVVLTMSSRLIKQQTYRIGIVQRARSKQQEFLLMLCAPVAVNGLVVSMMPSFYKGSATMMSEAIALVMLAAYVGAFTLFLKSTISMQRNSYEN